MSSMDFAAEEKLIETRWRNSLRPQTGNVFFKAEQIYRLQEQEREVLNLLRRLGRTDVEYQKILDIGCGRGGWLAWFIKWGAKPENLTGVDLIPERIDSARAVLPEGVALMTANAAKLDLPDASFDVIVMFLVLSLIADAELRRAVARETLRMLKPNGLILWYDYRYKPRNLEVRAMGRDEVESLFPGCEVKLGVATPIPPIRKLAHYSWLLAHTLGAITPLRTHHIGYIKKVVT
jgi:ubiquinone/menaquinone biosynthesis C-methylase UbiE